MEFFIKILLFLTVLCFVRSDIINQSVDRTIDLSTQLVRESIKIVAEESAGKPTATYKIVIPKIQRNNLAFITAKDGSKRDIKIKEETLADSSQFVLSLQSSLPTQNIHVDVVYSKNIKSHPEQIGQSDKQLVKYTGLLHFYSPYKTTTQKTLVKLSSTNIISYSQVKPFTVTSNKIKYGPYENVEELSNQSLVVHYENSSPFLTVTYMERYIEVSHWGNIAVKESISLEHTGAKLKGSFSRYEFQKDGRSGQSAVKSYKTMLPASATGVYYRDSNGNISTSNMNVLQDAVELELRPRFPLFGGWKTQYMLGYNVPSFEYLFYSNEQFVLKMRVIDHIYDDMVIDEALIKVVLPEGCKNIKLITPYPVKRSGDEVFSTYLDTVGRPVISFSKKNLIENHISDFDLQYSFSLISLLQEPLLVTSFIYCIFILTIIYLRLDFSITTHSHKE